MLDDEWTMVLRGLDAVAANPTSEINYEKSKVPPPRVRAGDISATNEVSPLSRLRKVFGTREIPDRPCLERSCLRSSSSFYITRMKKIKQKYYPYTVGLYGYEPRK